MNISECTKKLFGVALDAADDPWTLQLKQAWMLADHSNLDWISRCQDPYDVITGSMASLLEKNHIKPVGKFPVPSWLQPKPNPTDLPYVNKENYESFFERDGLFEIVNGLKSYVAKNIIPDIPVMAGIDHAATAGVISALAELYGPGKLCAIVLDQHFDAFPLSVRLDGLTDTNPRLTTAAPLDPQQIPVGFSDRFCCGSFWAYLMEAGIILPQNLIFIGVADYPGHKETKNNKFSEKYLDFEKRGCNFFPLKQFEGQYTEKLTGFIREKCNAPYVYISLDLDVGSFSSTYAARYMNRPGVSERNLLYVAGIINEESRRGKFKIAGMDIMEFNMHFLGIEMPDGVRDTTVELVQKFLTTLTLV